eukprot:TRINITY_DN9373_c0_g1_i1.p1 TRINITY_DN9373_c0_g1~~TRINITY_DN9373_c0_g1_i1.p1  ORF type:complete len:100 (-),score=15.16 TRINITY_DN9373_c0_g1_i1:12-311(-)
MKSQEPPDGEFNRLYQDYHEVIIIEDEEGRIIYHNIHIVDCDNPGTNCMSCLLYTSDAADDLLCVDLGGRRIIKKKKLVRVMLDSRELILNITHVNNII